MIPPRAWFAQIWPFAGGKHALHGGYLALREQPHLLADIAMRNYVFAPCPDKIAEGRRRCALEIISLAGMDPRALWDVIEAKPANQEKRA
jgi:hypothetical protein